MMPHQGEPGKRTRVPGVTLVLPERAHQNMLARRPQSGSPQTPAGRRDANMRKKCSLDARGGGRPATCLNDWTARDRRQG